MTIICQGGQLITKIQSWRDDFSEYKYKIEDSLDRTYVDEIPFNYESKLTELEQCVRYDDVVKNERYDLINVESDENYHYFYLHFDYTIHKCDVCGKKYLDYLKYISGMDDRRESIFYYLDHCNDCRKKQKKDNRKRGFEKAQQTMFSNESAPSSKQQKYICNLVNGQLNKPIRNFFADILIESNIVIEYDGSGHFMRQHFNDDITENKLRHEDLKRDKVLQKEGYKVLRIESKKDYLPSDEEIFNIINQAKMKFNNGDVFYKVDIDKNYSKEDLRKIKSPSLMEVN